MIFKWGLVLYIIACLGGCKCNCIPCVPDTSDSSGDEELVIAAVTQGKGREYVKNAVYKLLMTMEKGSYVPIWVGKKDLSYNMAKTIVYYDGLEARAIELAERREPCRLHQHRCYDVEKFHQFFGYRESPYRGIELGGIAIYTFTPVRVGPNQFENIHVLNVMWPDFSSASFLHESPILDLGTLRRFGDKYSQENKIRDMLSSVFSKIQTCVKEGGYKELIFLGNDMRESIATLRDELNIDYKAILNDVFARFIERPDITRSSIGKTHFTHLTKSGDSLEDAIREFRIGKRLGEILFVNSVSPVALLGNGNSLNDSFDGQLGRISAISVLGWKITNPRMRFEHVPVFHIEVADNFKNLPVD